MRLPRRRFLHLAAGAAAVPAASRIAMAQTYPSRPVRFIVPFGTAGGTDIVARTIAHQHVPVVFVSVSDPVAQGFGCK